jgi:hypothetical protein
MTDVFRLNNKINFNFFQKGNKSGFHIIYNNDVGKSNTRQKDP